MPNGSGLYNLSGGQITPTSRQESILPIGKATRRRQEMTGRILPGEISWGGDGRRSGGKESDGFNILDLLKGMFSGLFGGGKGEISQEGRLLGRDPYQEYRQPLRGYGRTSSATTPSRSYSMIGE
jgi:hypothetical protein